MSNTVALNVAAVNDAPEATFSLAQITTEGNAILSGTLTSFDVDAVGQAPATGSPANSDTAQSADQNSGDNTTGDNTNNLPDEGLVDVFSVLSNEDELSTPALKPKQAATAFRWKPQASAWCRHRSKMLKATLLTDPTTGEPVAVEGLSINADGSWSFDPGDGAYNALAEGEVQTITVNYQVADAAGLTDDNSFVITLTGTNDAPVATFSAAQDDATQITGQLTN